MKKVKQGNARKYVGRALTAQLHGKVGNGLAVGQIMIYEMYRLFDCDRLLIGHERPDFLQSRVKAPR